MKGEALCPILLVLGMLADKIHLASGQVGEQGVGEVEEVTGAESQPQSDSELNDYKEEKNHSEAIQRILRDFEKTLVENKIMLDTSTEEAEEEVNLDLHMNRTSIESNTISNSSSMDGPGLEVIGANGNLTMENGTGEVARVRMVCNNTMPETGLISQVMLDKIFGLVWRG